MIEVLYGLFDHRGDPLPVRNKRATRLIRIARRGVVAGFLHNPKAQGSYLEARVRHHSATMAARSVQASTTAHHHSGHDPPCC
ncbi:hypothetical protein GCM10010532_064280 [Dactylosporangium siamense]|uniref:Uncharacterized protein n=1 Tax=Dactylosporangium siamense TaxID=685454 RepID=A0A919PKS1_9ACTN|nr:hypothetical protein Dsi01nite_045570 [Dactylosporangium siamense]